MYRKCENRIRENNSFCCTHPSEAVVGSVRNVRACSDTNKVTIAIVAIAYAMTSWISRELAFQIAEQFAVLGAALNVRTAVIVGGMDMIAQALELNTLPHIIIATPGRIVDHLRSSNGEWNLSRVKFLVCTVGMYLVKTSNNRIRSLMKLIGF